MQGMIKEMCYKQRKEAMRDVDVIKIAKKCDENENTKRSVHSELMQQVMH
jgi:hypothetical protein